MLEVFGLLSGVITTIGYLPYIKDIFGGTTKPHRVTWLVYAILGSIAVGSQFAKGATNSLWLPGIETLTTIIVFILSIKFGVGGFSKKDAIELAAAGLGLVAWYFTREAAVALYIVILVDAIGTLPTVEKAYKDPGSETISAWSLVTLGGTFAALSVGQLSFVLLAYPIYIIFANAAVVVAILLGKRRLNLKTKQ